MKLKLQKEWDRLKKQEFNTKKTVDEFLRLLINTNNPLKVAHYWNELAKALEQHKIAVNKKVWFDSLHSYKFTDYDIEKEIRHLDYEDKKSKRRKK
jgi:hypothetical protein